MLNFMLSHVWVKLKNEKMGDYFPFRIAEVTHREGSLPEKMLQPLMENETEYEYFEEDELDEYIESYKIEGWSLESVKENKAFINKET
ncbi:uncharacterized protein Dvar_63960 [Desulfosarcina variabilis str. Montpellier]